ncbi:MAG: hypothetical protein J5501_00990 [Ruminococcus sp.]|nr:hypothetical protein [Ruminococcus sp.]
MRIARIIAAASAAAVLSASLPLGTVAADAKYCRLTLLDFDGNEMGHLTVLEGEPIVDTLLESIDTDSLHSFIGTNTEMGFSSWSEHPNALTENFTVQALYRKMTISLENMPSKTEYFDNYGDIDLSGLTVIITSEIQLPEKDANGKYMIERDITNISSACTTKPENLQTAFASGNTATVNVYPISSEKSIATYEISYFPYAGDADMDGHVTSADASYILSVYSALATGNTVTYAATQKKRMDVDGNGRIEPADASLVLGFYANASVEEHPTWKKVLETGQ